jgi:hypothetical protein
METLTTNVFNGRLPDRSIGIAIPLSPSPGRQQPVTTVQCTIQMGMMPGHGDLDELHKSMNYRFEAY